MDVCCHLASVWCWLLSAAPPQGAVPKRRSRHCAAPCDSHWFSQWFSSFSHRGHGARPGPGRSRRKGQGRALGLARAPWQQQKAGNWINQFIQFPPFRGRQSAILQGRLPPAAAACPPPGSCRFFDFPLVFPYESAMVQGVLRWSPEVLARGPGATGRSKRSIRF